MNPKRTLGGLTALIAVCFALTACDGPKIDVSKSPKSAGAAMSHPKVPSAPPTDGDKKPGETKPTEAAKPDEAPKKEGK